MTDAAAAEQPRLLRVSSVWHDEVMADAVLSQPTEVVLGATRHRRSELPLWRLLAAVIALIIPLALLNPGGAMMAPAAIALASVAALSSVLLLLRRPLGLTLGGATVGITVALIVILVGGRWSQAGWPLRSAGLAALLLAAAEVIVIAKLYFRLEALRKLHASATFLVPEIGLPGDFTIIRPSSRGYVLTLSEGMAGVMRLGGQQLQVAQFLASAEDGRGDGVAGRFRATPITAGDWGVIELDRAGIHRLFFCFVPSETPLPRSRFRDPELLLPALALAFIVHGTFVVASFAVRTPGNDVFFPAATAMTTEYIQVRPPDAPAEAPAASTDGQARAKPSATRGSRGKAGGEGQEPRRRAPDPAKGAPDQEVPERVRQGLLTDASRSSLSKVAARGGFDDELGRALARLQATEASDGSAGGSGAGTGLGFGPGADGTGTTRGGKKGGAGGGGAVQGDFQSGPDIDTGETRKARGPGGTGSGRKEVAVVGTGTAAGDFGGLSKAEIDRVVKSRQGLLRACYQRELNRVRGLGGTLLVNFKIAGNGEVKSARIVPSKSSLRNASVESCVSRQIMKLQFPAKGGTAIVNYPFIFEQG